MQWSNSRGDAIKFNRDFVLLRREESQPNEQTKEQTVGYELIHAIKTCVQSVTDGITGIASGESEFEEYEDGKNIYKTIGLNLI